MKTLNIQFVNESATTLFGFSNEINIGADGWAMVAPFGDHHSDALIPDENGVVKKQRAIQRIDKEGCDKMVAGFYNERRGIRKFLKGCNIYVGHPDMPGLGKFYPDKEPKGVFMDLAVRADGLYGLPVFTNEGSEIVENKRLRAFSGRFGDSEACGEVNGVPAYRPVKIFSAGLTNNPHLPVHFFNSDDTLADAPNAAADQQKQTMKKKLIAVCALLGIQFANEAADDAATEAALDQVSTKVAAFANEQTSIKKKLLALCASVGISFANEAAITDPTATLVQVEEKVKTINTDLTAARTSFANERLARIGDELTVAVKSGRITEADKPTWEGRLKVEAQFANELTALRALKAVVKTESIIKANRGGKETEIDISNPQARTQFINEAMDEVAAELKLDRSKDYTRIYNTVQQRHPALFQQMKQPVKR